MQLGMEHEAAFLIGMPDLETAVLDMEAATAAV